MCESPEIRSSVAMAAVSTLRSVSSLGNGILFSPEVLKRLASVEYARARLTARRRRPQRIRRTGHFLAVCLRPLSSAFVPLLSSFAYAVNGVDDLHKVAPFREVDRDDVRKQPAQ